MRNQITKRKIAQALSALMLLSMIQTPLFAAIDDRIEYKLNRVLTEVDIVNNTVNELECATIINSVPYVITEPGTYKICPNLEYAPLVASAAISILSDDVYLDLNTRVLEQTNTVAGVSGIQIGDGVTMPKNVAVVNGTVKGFSSVGILVDAGCEGLTFDNVIMRENGGGATILLNNQAAGRLFETPVSGGIMLIGTRANPITDVTMNNCQCLDNDSGIQNLGTPAGVLDFNSVGMLIRWVNRMQVTNCNFDGTVSNRQAEGVIYLFASDLIFDNCSFSGITGQFSAHGLGNNASYGAPFVALTAASAAAGQVTFTTNATVAGLALQTGTIVEISGLLPNSYNGIFTIIAATTVAPFTFTVANPTTDPVPTVFTNAGAIMTPRNNSLKVLRSKAINIRSTATGSIGANQVAGIELEGCINPEISDCIVDNIVNVSTTTTLSPFIIESGSVNSLGINFASVSSNGICRGNRISNIFLNVPGNASGVAAGQGLTKFTFQDNIVTNVFSGGTTIAAASDGASLPQTTLNVASNVNFPATGTLYITTSTGIQTVPYTAKVGTNQFTLSLVGTGVLNTGNAVILAGQSQGYNFNLIAGYSDPTKYGLGNIIQNCTAVACQAGFRLLGQTGLLVQDCVADNNAIGFLLGSSAGVQSTNCEFVNNIAMNNYSIGFQDTSTSATNAFVSNQAQSNGTPTAAPGAAVPDYVKTTGNINIQSIDKSDGTMAQVTASPGVAVPTMPLGSPFANLQLIP